jgi:hypothetical protein
VEQIAIDVREEPNPSQISAFAARVFPHAAQIDVEWVAEGVSTFVYRIHSDGETFFMKRTLSCVSASIAC